MTVTLNEMQSKAVQTTDGPLLILAGAGAGKTKTVTERIVGLIKNGVPASSILAITFTNKAAAEMRERVHARLQEEGQLYAEPVLRTFHSFGVLFLREEYVALGLPRRFTIADEGDAMSILKEVIKARGLDPKQFEPRKIKSMISRQKGNGLTYTKYNVEADGYMERIVADMWEGYERGLKKEQSLDFDDLLLQTLTILKNNPEIREKWQKRFSYIHIDEYQDTNEVQYEIAKILSMHHKNICVVGDIDQNIYSWRGANIKNILHFEKDYPEATVITLEQNYRSTKTILSAANEVIKKNTMRREKNLFTENTEGDVIHLYEAYDENDEAQFVAEKSLELLDKGISSEEIAVLYRANFQSRVLEEAFLNLRLPYHVLGVRFFERKEVKDVLSYIRAAENRESLSDIKRIINTPARGIGKVTITKLFAGKENDLPPGTQKKIRDFYILLDQIQERGKLVTPSELIKFVIEHSGIKRELQTEGTDEAVERLENIEELASLAMKYDHLDPEKGLDALLEDASLQSDQDSLMQEEKKTGIRLMTVHASKGLEFKHVFIVGLEQDLFPHNRGNTSKEDMEEERRLMYVALTRAKEKLYLSYTTVRTLYGSRNVAFASEFLYDIPDELIEKETGGGRGQLINTIYL